MTFITAIIIGVSKFLEGAWIIYIIIASIVYIMIRIDRHYLYIAKQLSMEDMEMPELDCDRVKHFFDKYSSNYGDVITIIIPQFVISKWWHNILHNHTALF